MVRSKPQAFKNDLNTWFYTIYNHSPKKVKGTRKKVDDKENDIFSSPLT